LSFRRRPSAAYAIGTPFFFRFRCCAMNARAVRVGTPFSRPRKHRMRTTRIGIGLSLLLMAVGCRAPIAPPPADQAAVTAADLAKLGFAIASYEDGLKKAPSSAGDLRPFLEATPQERESLRKAADGGIVVIWGASVKAMKGGASTTVLAYARDVPATGGLA